MMKLKAKKTLTKRPQKKRIKRIRTKMKTNI